MTQLKVIANEIHEQAIADFKVSEKFAYSFIMKVKKIRDERLYKELGHTSFESYCESAWNVNRGYMDDRILLAESFGQNFDRTYGQLGHSKSLVLARMDPEVRQKVEQSVDINEATVRQLKAAEDKIREAERAKEEAERRAEQAANDARHWQGVAKSQPVRVETKTVEVVPDHIKKKMDQLEFDNTNLRHGYKSAKEKLQQYELRNTVEFDEEQARKQREKLQHEADFNTLELRVHINNFMEKVAITSYLKGAIASADPVTKKRLTESVVMLESFVEEIKSALNGRILGGVVNE